MVESVGLDSDNVVIETFSGMAEGLRTVARRRNLLVPSMEEFAENYGYPVETIQRLFPGVDTNQFFADYLTLDVYHPPVEGAREALQFLVENNIPRWIFTGSRLVTITRQYQRAGIDLSTFHPVITREDTAPYRKPAPEAWEQGHEKLVKAGVNPATSLYVDDAVVNYKLALKAGFQAALLLGSPCSRGYEKGVPPEDVLHSMHELPQFLQKRGLVVRARA